jgi:hypothetical protein
MSNYLSYWLTLSNKKQPLISNCFCIQFPITAQIVNKKIIFIFVAFLQKILKINFKIREFTFTLQF